MFDIPVNYVENLFPNLVCSLYLKNNTTYTNYSTNIL